MNSKTNKNPIEVAGLEKSFGSTKALDGLNLEVKAGEVHGFLGPNGSGKSTTIRVLLGLIRSDGGSASILGGDPWSDAVELHKNLAYVPDEVNLWPNLSGGEAIDLLGRLRGGIDRARKDALVDEFQFDPTKKFRTYSKGNRQKAAVIAALASDVDLYIMDEPTGGLDPLMESIFQENIIKLKEAGKTVLFSSHVLAEVEKICDRVTIIRDGKTVESGALDELRHLDRMSVRVELEQKASGLEDMKGVHGVSRDGAWTEFEVEADAFGATLEHILKFGVKNIVSNPPNLADIFMRHYDESIDSSPKERAND